MSIKRALIVVATLPIVVWLILFAMGALYRAPEQIPAGVPGQRVDFDGLRLRILQAGAGPDVLLLHGSPGSLDDWDPVARELGPSYRVTRMDRPGHGWSDAGASVDFNYNATVVRRVIRTLGLHDVIVVGHSFGGSVALALAEENPPEVTGFVVVATRGYSNDTPGAAIRLAASPVFGVGLTELMAGGPVASLMRAGMLAKWHPNEAAIPAGFLEQRIALWSEPKNSVTTARERLLGKEREQLAAHTAISKSPWCSSWAPMITPMATRLPGWQARFSDHG